jgi:hypothetical protein
VQAFGLLPALVGVFAEVFHGPNPVSFRLSGQHRAAVDRSPVKKDRAGTAFAVLAAAALDTEKTQFAERIEQSLTGVNIQRKFLSIDRQRDIHLRPRFL